MEWLYNKNGQAELFTYDDRLISKTGKNLAWIYNGNIYNIKNGKHIGWYELLEHQVYLAHQEDQDLVGLLVDLVMVDGLAVI